MPESIRSSNIHPDPVLTQWVVAYGAGPGVIQDRIAPAVPLARQVIKYATYGAALHVR